MKKPVRKKIRLTYMLRAAQSKPSPAMTQNQMPTWDMWRLKRWTSQAVHVLRIQQAHWISPGVGFFQRPHRCHMPLAYQIGLKTGGHHRTRIGDLLGALTAAATAATAPTAPMNERVARPGCRRLVSTRADVLSARQHVSASAPLAVRTIRHGNH